MDGQPGLAEGWDRTEVADPNVFRATSLEWRARANGGLRWVSGHIVDENGNEAETNSLNSVTVMGVLERVPDPIPFWHELYRVCTHAAQITIGGAYWSCVDALADPTKRRGLSEQMFVYLSAPSRIWMRNEPGEDGLALDLLDGIDFEPLRYVRITGHEWEARSDEAKTWGLTHNNNVCRKLEVGLQVYKPAREPQPK